MIAPMNTNHIHKALQTANIAEVSRKTGLSIRRLYQLRDGQEQFTNVTVSTFLKLDKWAKERAKAVAA